MPADRDALHESDLPLNLQRRLGLSSVIGDQIRRYERRRGDELPAAEVANLFALIGRREDAARIFVEAGQRIARDDLEERRLAARVGLRLLPQSFRERRALKRVRRIARAVSPGAGIYLEHKPHALVVERGLPARAADGGVGCALLDGAIHYVFAEYRASGFRVVHRRCEGRSEERCEWLLESASENGGDARVEQDDRGSPDTGDTPPADPRAVDGSPAEPEAGADAPGGGRDDATGSDTRPVLALSDRDPRHPEAAPGG